MHPICEEGNDPGHTFLEGGKSRLLQLGEAVFRNKVCNLEIIDPVDQDHESTIVDVAQTVLRVTVVAGKAEPEHVDGNAVLDQREMRGLP